MKKVCVYCASSTSIDEKYINVAKELAAELVNNDYGVVYGGGEVGLMGALADKVLELGGSITGVIPRFMVEVEWAHKKVKNMVQVETMYERKTKLIEDVSAVIALPGSTGTLDELADVISLKKLGIFTKPIIIINSFGFYDPLLELFEKMIEERFMRPEHRNIWSSVRTADEVVNAIVTAPEWNENAIKIAAL
jgi:uncharacterized protein (TIGR00730 family)